MPVSKRVKCRLSLIGILQETQKVTDTLAKLEDTYPNDESRSNKQETILRYALKNIHNFCDEIQKEYTR